MATGADDHPSVGNTSFERLLVHIATLADECELRASPTAGCGRPSLCDLMR